MRPTLTVLLLILSPLLVGSGERLAININDLIKTEIFYNDKFSLEPYTGEVISYYENGEMEFRGYITEGMKNGLWEYFFENGSSSCKTSK